MAEQKLIYRQAIANSQGIPLAEVPPCSAMVVWENYQSEKDRYEDLSDKYKLRAMEVNEVFPQENRKVFTLVERAISEASIEDVRRTAAGGQAYDKQDALVLLKTAMELHDFVSPQISDRACQTARSKFENYRQPPAATIPEYIAEFRRRLDYCCKIRGDKIADVYKDFELKHFLLSGLYEPAWGTCIRTCQMTRTMPTTFEGVEAALREEEAARALSSLKDPYGDTAPMAAHATRASAMPSSSPSACTVCWVTFTPKKGDSRALQNMPR